MRLKLKLKVEHLELEKEDGTVLNYTIRELNGTGRAAFQDYLTKHVTINADGSKTVANTSGLEHHLIHLSVLDSEGKNVPKEEIGKWPSAVVEAVAEKARDLSALGDKAEGNA